MDIVNKNGKHICVVDGKLYEHPGRVVDAKFGLLTSDLQQIASRGLGAVIAQFYTLVGNGLILTKHIFQGLNRGLYCDGNPSGDKEKLVYTRKPSADYEWAGGSNGAPVKRQVPLGRVFAVLISQNMRHKADFPEIAGWIERWNWIEEDQGLSGAPVGWVDRYDRKLWSEGL